jgi:tetratricopeptide (TPR) repeat protein
MENNEGVHRTAMLLVLLLAGGCAPRGVPPETPPPSSPAPVVDTDALIRAGCYRCLESAFEAAQVSPQSAFQIAALLALRSKELGLPYAPWIARASELLPLGEEWPFYLEIVNVVRVDPLSGDREEILNLTTAQRRPIATVELWREALKTGAASRLFRAYLDLTLACTVGPRQQATDAAAEQFDGVPLIEYRIGTCGSHAHLAALRANHPEFADADLPLGRNALESARPDQEEALRRFRAARAAFPASAVITASIGDVHREREEWSQALEAYDATLALVETHRDALMGRTVALSNLSRHDEAIATATRILELGNWFMGGAYFWRAWNHYNLGNIPAARADVELARGRGSSAPTLVLAGMIAWREKQLGAAETDFQAALAIDRGQCEAAALQGGVRAARARWADAVASFEHAQQCFDLTIALRRKFIEEINAGPGSPEGKAGQVARHERAMAEAQKNRDDAMQNVVAIQKRLNPSSR